jgi:hypothetical protein
MNIFIGEDRQGRTARTGQTKQERQNRNIQNETGKTSPIEQDRHVLTAMSGQPWQVSHDMTVMKGQPGLPGQYYSAGLPGQDCRDSTVRADFAMIQR